jgi:hypothetical protein
VAFWVHLFKIDTPLIHVISIASLENRRVQGSKFDDGGAYHFPGSGRG